MTLSPRIFTHFVALGLLYVLATPGTLTAAEVADVGRLVEVRPPHNEPVRIPKAWEGLVELAPQNLPAVVIEVDDDATRLRTANATLPTPEVFPYLAYQNAGDSGLYIPLRASDEGALIANHQVLGTCLFGFADVFTQYDLLVYVAPESGLATFRVSLWDSDPLGIAYSICTVDGIPAPIPGTTVTFSNLPPADAECASVGTSLGDPACPGLYRLRASFLHPQTLPNFHCYEHYGVYMVLEMLEGCHAGWRIAGEPGKPATHRPEVGYSARTIIHTSQGTNTGAMTCCDSGTPCPNGNECSHDSFCSNGVADTTEVWTATFGYWPATVASLSFGTTSAMFIRPVSADAKPQDEPAPDAWRIAGDVIFLESGDRPVWFDVYMTGWDPNEEGLGVWAYGVTLEQGSLSSGDGEPLTLFTPGCAGDGRCEQIIGPESTCKLDELECDFVAQDSSRADFITHGIQAVISAVSNTQAAWGATQLVGFTRIYRCQGTTDVGKVCHSPCEDTDHCAEHCPLECETDCFVQCVADHTDRYLGTFALHVPSTASGNYSIGLSTRTIALVGSTDCYFALNLDGGARVTITDRGTCRYTLELDPNRCTDGITREQCELLADVTDFALGATCEPPKVVLESCCFGDNRCEEVVEGSCMTSGGQVIPVCGSADRCTVPSASFWGLSALTLALLTLAKIRFGRAYCC